MKKKLPPLPYTICFCTLGDDILMVHRVKEPMANEDNGLGGKRDFGIKTKIRTKKPMYTEHPNITNIRELWEEAEIDLKEAEEVRFAGIVTWAPISDLATHSLGMYAYTAKLKPHQRGWMSKDTPEGRLEWQPASHVCSLANKTVVSNIPYFLPHMLVADIPNLYELSYEGKKVTGMKITVLPDVFHP